MAVGEGAEDRSRFQGHRGEDYDRAAGCTEDSCGTIAFGIASAATPTNTQPVEFQVEIQAKLDCLE